MSVLEIKKYPEKILREKTAPVNEFDSGLQRLIDDMTETMYAAPGVGLAANQVGVSKQVSVIDVSTREEQSSLIVLVNPEIIHKEGECSSEEGCLSIPEYTTIVKRAEKVKVKAFNRHGEPVEIEGDGLLARALQHEIDHLNGFLLIDRIGRIKKEFFKKRYAREKALSRK
ncbi:MAG TPA: peptide deformylase [Nitrospirae bacterium]|nr:peptide deformylase [bacterium BMS3Abin06]HDH12033.1 peptide deformylase [Nitrospirota bacterium]HDZ00853.1 peptide deformylase [Nitrospirota bacterium]